MQFLLCRDSSRRTLVAVSALSRLKSAAISCSFCFVETQVNEYLAIDSGGHVSDLVFARNAASLECFPEKPSWCRNEQVCQGGQNVKRFERSNGPDIALYKNYLFLPLVAVSALPRLKSAAISCSFCFTSGSFMPINRSRTISVVFV